MQRGHLVLSIMDEYRSRLVQLQNEHKSCFDCTAPKASWASVPNGIFVCIECAYHHRMGGLDISVTKLKSPVLDWWKDEEVIAMELGGNQKFKDFLKQHNQHTDNNKFTASNYTNQAAVQYRNNLKKEVQANLDMISNIK